MVSPSSAPVGDVLQRALDGAGAAVPVGDARQLRDLLRSATSLGFLVLDVPADSASNGFALGPLWCALDVVEPVEDIPPVGAVAAPARTVRWMRAELDHRLSRLATRAPVVIVVRDLPGLEPLTRAALVSLRESTGDRPIVWVEPPPPPARYGTRTAAADAAPGRDGSLVLRMLAAADVALTRADLAALTGLSHEGALEDTLAALIAAGAVVECREHLALATPAHYREAVEGVTPALRRGLRRGVFDVLRNRGVANVALAEMAMDSGLPDERAAIDVLTDAMYQLRNRDPESAAVCGLGAARLLRGSGDLLTALAWQLLPLLWQVGRVEDARELARRVFSERGLPDAEAQTLLWIARFEGSAERALEHSTTALSLGRISLPVRARLLGTHLRLLSTLGKSDEVDRLLPGALADAEETGEWEALSRLQTCDAIRCFYSGDYIRAESQTALADATWRRAGADEAERMPEMIWGPHLRGQLGRPQEALAELDDLLESFERRGQTFAARFVHSQRSHVLLTLGRLAEASDEAVLATTASEQMWSLPAGARDRLQAIALSVRLKVALHVGDAGELADVRSLLSAAAAPLGSEAAGRIAWWMFLLDDAQGLTASADRSVNPDTLSPLSWLDPSDEILVCRALLMNGYRAAGLRVVEHASERAARAHAHPLARTLSDHLAGLYRWDPALLEAAQRGWERLGRPLEAAAARSDLGVRCDEAGEPRGIELVRAAHDQLLALGAHRDAWRIRWWLRARGHLVSGERSADDSPLTPAESRVVDRAALGSTVGRIAAELALSPHTVTTHLRHIYTKLDINSRAELTRWAAQHARLAESGN
jgi:DNA-binding CsgD family transcriptional regulator